MILYLGLVNGDMVSQALAFGWAQNGVPWQTAFGLVVLTLAAVLIPVFTRHNVYCRQLCPHGAVQQLVRNRLPWRVRISTRASRGLRWIPALLVAWCLTVTLLALPYSLVDVEPFDAWVFRIAGGATIGIAVGGLVVSMFVPMAYCKYGCPTGALLEYLRYNARSDQWTRQDWCCSALVALAVVIRFL